MLGEIEIHSYTPFPTSSLLSLPSSLVSLYLLNHSYSHILFSLPLSLCRRKVMPVVLHGDAAFSGQGIVPEVMEVRALQSSIVQYNIVNFSTMPHEHKIA